MVQEVFLVGHNPGAKKQKKSTQTGTTQPPGLLDVLQDEHLHPGTLEADEGLGPLPEDFSLFRFSNFGAFHHQLTTSAYEVDRVGNISCLINDPSLVSG